MNENTVRVVNEVNEKNFEQIVSGLKSQGYKIIAAHCGFVNSEKYGFCSNYQAILAMPEALPGGGGYGVLGAVPECDGKERIDYALEESPSDTEPLLLLHDIVTMCDVQIKHNLHPGGSEHVWEAIDNARKYLKKAKNPLDTVSKIEADNKSLRDALEKVLDCLDVSGDDRDEDAIEMCRNALNEAKP